MTDERLILAIGRLERALSRIETAVAGEPTPAPAPPSGAGQDLADLRARHARLRDATGAALARIDRLLGPRRD